MTTSLTRPTLTEKLEGTAALLCGGHSLTRTWHEDLFDDFRFVGAVNTAGHRYRCHHVFASDPHIIKPYVDGNVRPPDICVVTSRVLRQRLAPKKISSILLEKIQGGPKGVCCPYTMPNALMFYLQRVRMVEIFGTDFAGQKGDTT